MSYSLDMRVIPILQPSARKQISVFSKIHRVGFGLRLFLGLKPGVLTGGDLFLEFSLSGYVGDKMFTSGWWPLLHCLFCNSGFCQSHWCAVGFKPNGSQSGSLITAHLLSQSVRSPDVLLQIQWCLWKPFLLDGSFDSHPPSKTFMHHHSILITKWTSYNLFMGTVY